MLYLNSIGAAVLAAVYLRRGQPARPHRRGILHDQRRRPSDASQEGAGATGFAVFQPEQKVIFRKVVTCKP
jgi:hypothetical protein